MNIHDLDTIRKDTKYPKRTQISLSVSLYYLVKYMARKRDISLSQVIREGLFAYFSGEEKRRVHAKETLRSLANAPWTELKNEKSGWASVRNPRQLIRYWRAKD